MKTLLLVLFIVGSYAVLSGVFFVVAQKMGFTKFNGGKDPFTAIMIGTFWPFTMWFLLAMFVVGLITPPPQTGDEK